MEIEITIKNLPSKKLEQLHNIFNSGRTVKGFFLTGMETRTERTPLYGGWGKITSFTEDNPVITIKAIKI